MKCAAFTIDKVLTDHRLLGAALGAPATWSTWLVVLKAAFGLALNDAELKVFGSVAGGRRQPKERVRELWAIAGRRGGKSRMAAALAVYFAAFVPHKLAHGERGMVLVLAMSLEQAKVVFNYALAFLRSSPVLQNEIAETTRNEIRLKNGIVIAIHTNSFRTVRGRTLLAAIFDEVSFWRDDTSATPDSEVYSAVLPSLATCNGLLVGISSPYRRVGLLHAKHKQHFGVDGDDVLVVQGSSKKFNPLLTDAVIEAQRAADPTAASSEWDAEFRADIAAFLDDVLIEGAIEHGRPLELSPLMGSYYRAFTDASGGRGDAYSVAVGHKEGEYFVIDVIRGTHPPFDPHEVTRQYAVLLKQYRIGEVTGDHYAAEWVAGAWRDCGVSYVRSDINKSQIYLEALPLFARGIVRLPDHPRLLRELRLLERHTHRSGKDTVDHGRNGSDDYANAACGVLRDLACASAPALWKPESFLVEGAPVPIPEHAAVVFAVLVAGERGSVAGCFFARPRIDSGDLIVLDVDLMPLTLAVFSGTVGRLTDFARRVGALAAFIFATGPLAQEMNRIGVQAEIIDALIAEDDVLLALSASVHITSNRVKITSEVLAKSERLPGILSPTAPLDEDNPLRVAALTGIALGLDAGRSLKARAA
jgi:hypothetical protein